MDVADVACPVVFRQRCRQSDVELEVWIFFFDLSEVVDVEELA